MEKKTLDINKNEAQALIGLIDIAIKQEGLKIANNAIYWANKIDNLFKETPSPETGKDKK